MKSNQNDISNVSINDTTIQYDDHDNDIDFDNINKIVIDRHLDIAVYMVDDVKDEQSSPMNVALAHIPNGIDKQYVQQLSELVHTYSDVFPDELPGALPQHVVEHVIEFKPDARVIKLPAYNLAPKHLVFVKETIDMLLSKGFIQRSVSPYAVPINS